MATCHDEGVFNALMAKVGAVEHHTPDPTNGSSKLPESQG